MMAFDECLSHPASYDQTKTSMELTHRWLERCFKRFIDTQPLYEYPQYLLPIVQGGMHANLRKESALFVTSASESLMKVDITSPAGYGMAAYR